MTAEPQHTMDQWAPRRQLSLEQARARTRTVKRLRLGLVGLATVVTGVFLGYIASTWFDSAPSAGGGQTADQIVSMINPRFRGRDSSGQAYLIISESAQRRRTDSDLIDLFNPKLTRPDGSEIVAPAGLWNRKDEVLELYEDVVITDWAGYVFYTTHARIFMQTGQVEGDQELQGTGPLGDVRSDAYELFDGGNHIRLVGNVRTILYEDEPDEEDTPG